ncbi:MAG: Smr/MutS family protein [Myxococcota bacterium]|jgi:DNA-nicking Smr family endonuclease|nr:Smr/MutS family protein [Myxococcota bacterium]
MRELRAGSIRPQESIDLHGFTREGAYRRLCNATARARSNGKRCVVVIHGKGQRSEDGVAVLRDALDDWLQRVPLVEHVIGSCRAQPRDGGTGATYLLLRAPGEKKPAK